MNLIDLLHRGGVANVEDHRVPGHAGSLAPVGIIVHHTAMKDAGLEVVRHGRSDLAGPLCNININRAGHVNVITDGVAWHAGGGSSKVLADLKRNVAPANNAAALHLPDDFGGGNSLTVGIEVDNDGIGEPYPQVQIAGLVWTCAAIIHLGIPGGNQNRAIHHREWTARKVDMSYHGPLRGLIADRLKEMK